MLVIETDSRQYAVPQSRAPLSEPTFCGMVGGSEKMQAAFESARRIAQCFSVVLIIGPAGAGKERLARALHQASPAVHRPFLICNCGADNDSAIETKLFGHGWGAAPDHSPARQGLLALAESGTVFIDEIGQLTPQEQTRLLQAMEQRESIAAGVGRFEARIIAATTRDLVSEVTAGRFQEGLFRRLRGTCLHLPPLSERREDIPALCRHFLNSHGQMTNASITEISPESMQRLQQCPWPGNVRELENAVLIAASQARGNRIEAGDLPQWIGQAPKGSNHGEGWMPVSLEEMRRIHVERVLALCGGNRVRASRILGIGRTSLYRFLKRGCRKL